MRGGGGGGDCGKGRMQRHIWTLPDVPGSETKISGRKIPGERTVYRIMQETGLVHRPKRKPNGITKAERNARKSEDLLK